MILSLRPHWELLDLLGVFNQIQWKSRGFKEKKLIQVSRQRRKGESPINASTKVKAEGEPCSAASIWAAQPRNPAPQESCLYPSCCTRATRIPAADLASPFQASGFFFKNVLTPKMLCLWYLIAWDDGDYALKPTSIFTPVKSSFALVLPLPSASCFCLALAALFWLYSSPSPCTPSLPSKLPL